jgi:hypothetical protein
LLGTKGYVVVVVVVDGVEVWVFPFLKRRNIVTNQCRIIGLVV